MPSFSATASESNELSDLKEGDIAPDFTLPSDNGENITLSSFRGKKNVVLYFYPKDDTPGCTVEAKDFTSGQENFDALDTVIIGASKDSIASHQKFKDKHDLSISLVSFDATVAESLDSMYCTQSTRSTFLIDKEGRVARAWKKVKVAGHADEVLEAVKSL